MTVREVAVSSPTGRASALAAVQAAAFAITHRRALAWRPSAVSRSAARRGSQVRQPVGDGLAHGVDLEKSSTPGDVR